MLLLGWIAAVPVAAAQTAAAKTPFSDDLTGDWGGVRSTLAQQGVTVDIDSTHFYQGLTSGTGDKSFDYGGRVDTYLNFDTGKLDQRCLSGHLPEARKATPSFHHSRDMSRHPGGRIARTKCK